MGEYYFILYDITCAIDITFGHLLWAWDRTPSPCVSCCAGSFLLTWHKLEPCEKVEPQLRDCFNQIVLCTYPWSILLIDNWYGKAALSIVGNGIPGQVVLGRRGEQAETVMESNKNASSYLSSMLCALAPALASLVNSLQPVSCSRPFTPSSPHWLWSWFYHTTESKLELCFRWLCFVWFGALPYLLPWQNSHHGITACGYSIKGSSLHGLWNGMRN